MRNEVRGDLTGSIACIVTASPLADSPSESDLFYLLVLTIRGRWVRTRDLLADPSCLLRPDVANYRLVWTSRGRRPRYVWNYSNKKFVT